jgi:hypothetical protein
MVEVEVEKLGWEVGLLTWPLAIGYYQLILRGKWLLLLHGPSL